MKAGVVGSPIAHSLSPAMHRAAHQTLGLAWTYGRHDVGEGELADFVRHLDVGWCGLSVTAPLKHEAAALAVARDAVVTSLGVANTLVRDGAGWSAHNTDVPGAEVALRTVGVERVESVRVIGAGATAQSMLLVAKRLGVRWVELVVRDRDRAAATLQLATRLDIDVRTAHISETISERVDLLIATTPGRPWVGREHEFAGTSGAVFDVVYDPWPSGLLTSAHESGLPCVTGLDLLAHQAALQVLLMTGEPVDPDVLLTAALAELDRRTA